MISNFLNDLTYLIFPSMLIVAINRKRKPFKHNVNRINMKLWNYKPVITVGQ